MDWRKGNVKRSYCCNRDLLRFYRTENGWSQQQLADVSGVSIRVICKAEAGDSVAKSSISKLSAAFSNPGNVVYPEDLISFPLDLCRMFVSALHEQKYRMPDVMRDLIEPNAVFRVTGEADKVPFAGEHVGVESYRLALKKFFRILDYTADFDHTCAYDYFPSGTDVVVWGKAQWQLKDGSGKVEQFAHRQRYRFRRGLLYAFEDHYDVEQGKKLVSAASARMGDKVFAPAIDSRF